MDPLTVTSSRKLLEVTVARLRLSLSNVARVHGPVAVVSPTSTPICGPIMLPIAPVESFALLTRPRRLGIGDAGEVHLELIGVEIETGISPRTVLLTVPAPVVTVA